jgi:hypothetical protein
MKTLALFILSMVVSNPSLLSQNKNIYVDPVVNSVGIGPLTGNKNLAFGVKNIIVEAAQDKGYSLNSNRDNSSVLQIEVVYFDILNTNSSVSIFHKDENTVVVRLKGKLLVNNRVVKEYLSTEKSSEISVSTMIISEDGGFNQQSARNAIKKACIQLTDKLL